MSTQSYYINVMTQVLRAAGGPCETPRTYKMGIQGY